MLDLVDTIHSDGVQPAPGGLVSGRATDYAFDEQTLGPATEAQLGSTDKYEKRLASYPVPLGRQRQMAGHWSWRACPIMHKVCVSQR